MKLSELKKMCEEMINRFDIGDYPNPHDEVFAIKKLKAVVESLEASVDYRVYDEPVMLISGLKTLLESNDKGDE